MVDTLKLQVTVRYVYIKHSSIEELKRQPSLPQTHPICKGMCANFNLVFRAFTAVFKIIQKLNETYMYTVLEIEVWLEFHLSPYTEGLCETKGAYHLAK